MMNDLIPTIRVEINVNVGQVTSAFIDEPLKEQIVLQRVNAAQEQIDQQTPGSRTAYAMANALASGKFNDVSNHEEEIRKLQFGYDGKFMLKLPKVRQTDRFVIPSQFFVTEGSGLWNASAGSRNEGG